MKIVLLAEGDTERAAKEHLKKFLDARAGGRPKVALQTSIFDGCLDERGVRGRTEKFLADNSVVDGKKLFEKLDLLQVAAVCPEFRAFLNTLLRLAGYEQLTQ